MRFIALYHLKDHVDQAKIAEAVNRRAEYEHPVELLAEYYTTNASPAVVAIYEADDADDLFMNSMAWMDVFRIEVMPVVGWEEGLRTLSG